MEAVKKIVQRLNRSVFNSVTKNKLVFNSCWEDPAVDRKLLEINDDSEMVMITSAGCNTLDYLLDEPAAIHCVDVNPAQNALLELKRAVFLNDDYPSLWQMFGAGSYEKIEMYYQNQLKSGLSPAGQQFWNQHLEYFDSSKAPSFYFRGTAGSIAHIIYKHIQHKGLSEPIKKLLDSKSLAEQRYYFEEIEPQLWNPLLRWLLKRDSTLAMLGVPKIQRKMIDDEVEGGLPAFIRQKIRRVFTEQPVENNYFWRVYLTGSYTKDCCPNYLKEINFKRLKNSVDRLDINTTSLTEFLSKNPGRYSHFVLLDHQDWISSRNPNKLEKEWERILKNSVPGARVLFRSAGCSRSFIPDFVYDHAHFEDEKANRVHKQDRVGTYGSTHLAIIHEPL